MPGKRRAPRSKPVVVGQLTELRRTLLAHYDAHKRDLPWRRRADAYGIWLSEIMLQQTQVVTVVPRYETFLGRFPSLESLAAASEQEVCEAWAGLGYYRRARLLHRAARQVVENHAGVFPNRAAALRELPGVGRYTAGAIASIAFGEAAPVVDGNVARVLARLFRIHGPVDDRDNAAAYWRIAEELVVGERPGDLNQALMELGATVCTPRQASCSTCPVEAFCAARAAAEVEQIPAPKKRAAPKALRLFYLWVEDGGAVWLARRPREGLWAGLWELPSGEGSGAAAEVEARYGVGLGPRLAVVRHELTHRRVTAHVHVPDRAPRWRKRADLRRFADPLGAPLSALARKAIGAALSARDHA